MNDNDEIKALLELAKEGLSDIKASDREKVTEAHMFIADLKIKSGDTKVPNPFIYNRYIEWRKEKGFRKDPLVRLKFFEPFRERFKATRDWQYRYYYLDSTPFDLSDKKFFEICRELDAEKAARVLRKEYEAIVKQHGKDMAWPNKKRGRPKTALKKDEK